MGSLVHPDIVALRRRAFRTSAALLVPGFLLASPSPQKPPPKPVLRTALDASNSDSLTIRLTWAVVSDKFGTADHYIVAGSSTMGLARTDTTTATADSFAVMKPLPGDSVAFTFAVRAVRRGITGPSATASFSYKTPPAPIDSSTVVVAVYVKPDTVSMAIGATQQMCAFYKTLDGLVHPDTVTASLSYCTQFDSQFPTFRASAVWRGAPFKIYLTSAQIDAALRRVHVVARGTG